MSSIRVPALVVINWLTRFLLFLTAVVTAFVLTFNSSRVIKNALIETGAYERFVPAVIEANAAQKNSSIPFNDPQVKQIIIQAFPAQELREKSEIVITSLYDWLEGKTASPDFAVSFAPNLDKLANDLGDYAFNRLATLPQCLDQPATFDPFTATCQPLGVDITTEKAKLIASIKEPGNVLEKRVYTSADLPKNDKGETLVQQYPQAPLWFYWATLLPWIMGLLTVLCIVLNIWLSRIRRGAVRDLGVSIFINGVFLALSPLLFGFVIPRYTQSLQQGLGGNSAQKVMSDVSQAITNELNVWLILAGAMIMIVGASMTVLERATRPKLKYANVQKRSGLISSIEARAKNGRFSLRSAVVPLQSSETSVTKRPKRVKNKKYRKIPKKEI